MVFEAPTMTDGSRTWVEKLYDHVNQHVQAEQGLLEGYIEATEGTESDALAYLVGLIVEDEKRHHRMFSEFAASLQHGLNWTKSGNEVPAMDFYKVDPVRIKELTDQLLENEESDLAALKHLHKMVKEAKDVTLWDLIVQIMQRDTEKHISILTFIKHHLN